MTVTTGVLVALLFLPALVWGIVADNVWRFILARRPAGHTYTVTALLASAMALFYVLQMGLNLVPGAIHRQRLMLLCAAYTVTDGVLFVSLALFRHLARVLTSGKRTPSRAWLFTNYGIAAAFVGVSVVVLLGTSSESDAVLAAYRAGITLYTLVVFAGVVRPLGALARSGLWRAGAGAGVPRRADVVVIVTTFFAALAMGVTVGTGGFEKHPTAITGLLVAIGLLLVAPLALRMLGDVLRGLVLASVMVGATSVIYFGVLCLRPYVPAELRPLVEVATVLAIIATLGPIQSWRQAWIDRVMFGRSRQRLADLQAFVHGLSPELGIRECTRRALDKAVEDRRIAGAAILLRDEEPFVAGEFAIDAIVRVWPRGSGAQELPERSLAWPEFATLPPSLTEGLVAANVTLMMPIASPRQKWGYALVTPHPLAVYAEEDLAAAEAFADQLALLLDAADLIARAVVIERALAHAEKLAAVGETAARIAHEIRNPVTAARSLAQQLAREPASPLNAEHAALILAELERVERQVSALLRFSRREELRVAPTDLGALTRAAVDSLRGRLEGAGIAVALDTDDGIVARIDGEKVRQVLVNLIENAMDALADAPAVRHLRLSVAGRNGTAVVAVVDTGPGVPADALPRLFEPFFSLKAQGTGLGLAIAKRTVEAHGGRIEARTVGPCGLEVRFEVPIK